MTTDGGQLVRLSDRRGRWIVALTVMGSALAFLEATVVNVALPHIGRDLDAEVSGLQWTLNAYLLTLAALILLGGSLGDRFGRRRVFVIGVVWFTAGSAICAIAPGIELLIAARAFQGIGGALLTPGSLAIIEATLHPRDRARAIGAWSALGGVAAAVGPLAGGWLVDAGSWRWVFIVPLPLGVLIVLLAPGRIPETRDPSPPERFDIAGSALVALGLAGVTFGLVEAEQRGFGSTAVAGALLIGAGSLAAFVLVERRSRHPVVPLGIFASRQFSAGNGVTFVVYAALGGVFFLLVILLQTALGYSAIRAGAATLPITGLMLVLSSRAGALAQRIGPRLPLTVGPIVIAAGMVLLARIGPGSGYVRDILPAVVVFGLGLSLTVAPITSAVLAATEERLAGVASGINNAVARTAQLGAITVLPLVAGLSGDAYRDPQALTDAFGTAMAVCAALAAAGGVLAFFTIRNDLLERGDEDPGAEAPYSCAVAGPPPAVPRDSREIGDARPAPSHP